MPLEIFCTPDVFRTAEGDGESVAGKCFGQSSFAALSVVEEASVLNVRDLVQSKEELQLLVLNMAKPGPRDRVMGFGLVGVGLSAGAVGMVSSFLWCIESLLIFWWQPAKAAAISGSKQIIAVDLVQSSIELAKSIGATHGLNTSNTTD